MPGGTEVPYNSTMDSASENTLISAYQNDTDRATEHRHVEHLTDDISDSTSIPLYPRLDFMSKVPLNVLTALAKHCTVMEMLYVLATLLVDYYDQCEIVRILELCCPVRIDWAANGMICYTPCGMPKQQLKLIYGNSIQFIKLIEAFPCAVRFIYVNASSVPENMRDNATCMFMTLCMTISKMESQMNRDALYKIILPACKSYTHVFYRLLTSVNPQSWIDYKIDPFSLCDCYSYLRIGDVHLDPCGLISGELHDISSYIEQNIDILKCIPICENATTTHVLEAACEWKPSLLTTRISVDKNSHLTADLFSILLHTMSRSRLKHTTERLLKECPDMKIKSFEEWENQVLKQTIHPLFQPLYVKETNELLLGTEPTLEMFYNYVRSGCDVEFYIEQDCLAHSLLLYKTAFHCSSLGHILHGLVTIRISQHRIHRIIECLLSYRNKLEVATFFAQHVSISGNQYGTVCFDALLCATITALERLPTEEMLPLLKPFGCRYVLTRVSLKYIKKLASFLLPRIQHRAVFDLLLNALEHNEYGWDMRAIYESISARNEGLILKCTEMWTGDSYLNTEGDLLHDVPSRPNTFILLKYILHGLLKESKTSTSLTDIQFTAKYWKDAMNDLLETSPAEKKGYLIEEALKLLPILHVSWHVFLEKASVPFLEDNPDYIINITDAVLSLCSKLYLDSKSNSGENSGYSALMSSFLKRLLNMMTDQLRKDIPEEKVDRMLLLDKTKDAINMLMRHDDRDSFSYFPPDVLSVYQTCYNVIQITTRKLANLIGASRKRTEVGEEGIPGKRSRKQTNAKKYMF